MNKDNIDSVIKSIGIRMGEPGVEEQNLQNHLIHEDGHYKTAVIISELEGDYYLNCIVYDQKTWDDFPGTMLGGGYSFKGLTLLGLSLIIEKGFKKHEMEVGFLEDARDDLVSYKLFPHEEDSKNKMFLISIRKMMAEIVNEQDNSHYGQ